MVIEEITEKEYIVGVTNTIAERYKKARSESKAPTFALTYKGTYKTLMRNCGFSEEKAKYIEQQYQTLYRESIEWVESHIKQATITGYVVGAFGLRLRTPLLKQSIYLALTSSAQAEARTAGNMLGQSWCLLNNRACVEVMRQVRKHPVWRTKIKPCLTIHDATYFLVENSAECIAYLNSILVKATLWNDDPLIYHTDIPLGGELSLFYPNWSTETVVPSEITEDQLHILMENSRETKK